ncbi:hypothetical protein KXX16_000017 [Aspergillus fumigatus]|nr:hypothetical protein KXX31_004496 [Aspergillus fumigatus]KAH1656078.1 hypothetical protein KXX16_000017 [Aspergillus fumigatus]KAH1754324.1 hypothetical protein KXX09_005110 [Aspergillus fumigatus]KAH1861073.1 hypothetical protein KXX54_000186 [Aspergillus fumigatus]KAH2008302.1 hypothetical protein KXV97_002095 [Aspergillus fumigatus]
MSTETSDATQAQQTWKAPPAGSPCWVEIPARDTQKLKGFYSAIFPSWEWRPAQSAEDQSKVQHYSFVEPKGLTGGIVQMPEGCAPTEQIMGSGMTVYYLVDSLDMVEKTIRECGGGTCLPKTPESSHGWFMNFRDPEGNRFGCYEIRHS